MTIKNLALLALALSSFGFTSGAFASGTNLVVCPWNGNDDAVTIRQDAGGELVALFSMVDHGTEAFKVEAIAPREGVDGAGLVYRGRGIELQVNTDGLDDDGYFKSTLSIPSLSVKGEAFDCKVEAT